MITPAFGLTATERVRPRLALDFTTASLDPRITFTRTTGASNPATYVDSSGVITAATNNQPRFDYDPVTLVCKGLLIEESRTNLLLNSLIDGTVLNTQIVAVTAVSTTLSFYGTGTVTLSGAHSASVVGAGAYPTRKTYTFTPTAGALTLTVAGTVQFAQLEAGAFPTSYIPTTSAALTRNADVATMTGTNFSDWFNATEGTFQVTASITGDPATNRMFEAHDGSDTNRLFIATINSAGSVRFDNIAGGVQTEATNLSYKPASGEVFTATGGYKSGSIKTSVNGQAIATATPASLASGINAMVLGARRSGAQVLNGHLASLNYFPQQLTSGEIQAFSKG